MNLSQFKSWFEGFTENMDGPPSKKQWARVQERVAEISADPMPSTVFIERYVRPYRDWWQPYWSSGTLQNQAGRLQGSTTGLTLQAGADDRNAFYNAGALEAKQVAREA